MKLLYVDDSPEELNLMTRLFAGNLSIKFHTKQRLHNAIDDHAPELDCVFLDVMRPDSFSLQDDMDTIRRISPAPVVFVTGGDANKLRGEAVESGADGLLEKKSLSPALMVQTASNAKLRSQIKAAQPAHNVSAAPLEQFSIGLDGTFKIKRERFSEVCRGLSADLRELSTEIVVSTGNISLAKRTRESASIANGLAVLALHDSCALKSADLRTLCTSLQNEVEAFGEANGVTIAWSLRSADYFQFGSYESGREGVRQLIMATIGLMPSGTTLLIATNTDPASGMAEIQLYTTSIPEEQLRSIHTKNVFTTGELKTNANPFLIALSLLECETGAVRFRTIGGMSIISILM